MSRGKSTQKDEAAAAVENKDAATAEAAKTTKAVSGKAKETDKKAGRTQKKTGAVKEELKPGIYIQFQGKESVLDEVLEKAKREYIAAGHRVSSIKSLQLYLKPEEYAAYYVINQKFAGKVNLF